MEGLPEKVNHKKRKRKQSNIEFLKSIQVPLNNRFQLLNEDENNITEHESSSQKNTVSPIVVTDHNTDVNKIINDLKIECQLKLLGIGRKIICKSSDDKKKLSDVLINKKINFYTHPENGTKLFKTILSGLPELSTETIIENLKEQHNITPIKIIMFNTSSPNKLYLCHFNKNEVSMKSLNTIKSVYHHIIKWQVYKPKNKGPTQCYRCSMYGHGASTCNRFQVCLLCGSNHETKYCTLPNTDNPVYKCFNCMSSNIRHDHKATDVNCPFRAKYELARNNNRNKIKRNPLNQTHTNFGPYKNKYIAAPPPPPLTTSYASQAAINSQYYPIHSKVQTPDVSYNTHQNKNVNINDNNPNNLFTVEEITNILLTSINELEKCTTKFDQLRVIANVLRNVYK